MLTLSIEERARRATSFNEDAQRYDRARPTYPPELFEQLWQIAGLGAEPRVVEVGCGTGQSSVALVKLGARLTCVELGANMAEIACRKLAEFPTATVEVCKFEEWDSKGAEYDLLFASSSWHWVLRDVRYQKAAAVLRHGGHLAVVHSEHVYPEGFDPLFHAIQDVYAEVTGSRREVSVQTFPKPGVFDKKDEEHIAEMVMTGAFDVPEVVRFLWHFDRTADEFIDLLGTFSDHWALEPDIRKRLFERIHQVVAHGPTGSIRKHYLTTLRIARRR